MSNDTPSAVADDSRQPSSAATTTAVRLPPFGFAERTNFDARQELQHSRSRHFSVPPVQQEPNIWRRPPPDFRPQAWAPRPPKRNSREAVQPWRYARDSDAAYMYAAGGAGRRGELPAALPVIMRSDRQQQQRHMRTVFRVVRPDTARRRFVQHGAIRAEPFGVPAPHDYRQYPPLKSLGLPELTTAADKDPYNIRFLTDNKDTIVGPLHDIKNIRDASGTLWSAVRLPPKWDPKRHLAQSMFPDRLCEYSRHRPQNRDPFEGFMDSVEATLERRWLEEKVSKSTSAAALSG